MRDLRAGWEVLRREWGAVLTAVLVFVTPSNLFLVLNRQAGYTHGLFSDYLLPRLYLSDLVLIALAGCLAWQAWRARSTWKVSTFGKHKTVLAAAWLTLGLAQLWTAQPFLGLLWWSRLSLIVFTGIHIGNVPQTTWGKSWSAWAVAAALFFQSSIALWQYWLQRSVAGYWLLGEPTLTAFGMAETGRAGKVIILPYGTTAHPNILAGFLAVYLYLLWQNASQAVPIKLKYLLSLLAGLTIVFTESFTALAILILAGTVLLIQKKGLLKRIKKSAVAILVGILAIMSMTPLLLQATLHFVPREPSIARRVYLHDAATRIWSEKPITGVGLGQFTRALDFTVFTKEMVAFLQPVHAVPMLVLSEAGLLGVLVIGLGIFSLPLRVRQRVLLSSVILVPALVLDHYLLTQPAGVLLMLLLVIREN